MKVNNKDWANSPQQRQAKMPAAENMDAPPFRTEVGYTIIIM